jgi:hypothetical protein
MSRVALSGNPLGTGTFTIASPNSNTDRTLNLPDASGTLNTSGAPNEVPAGSAAAPAIYPAGDTNTGIFFPAADTIAFSEGGVESMRIDASGNLGLGVTPSAWTTSFGIKALQVGPMGALVGSLANTNLAHNNYFDGTNVRYINSSPASYYLQADTGAHSWYIAPSGTAGNAISFTQAMTLDASGNLGVGTSSPASYGRIVAVSPDNASTTQLVTAISANLGQSVSMTFGGLRASSGAALGFAVNGSTTNAASIDTSGNLLVGTTSSGFAVDVGTKILPDGRMGVVVNDATTNTNTYHFNNLNATNNGYRFYVNVNGGINNYSGNNVNLSDERTKKNIEVAGGYLQKICAIPVKLFNYKDEAEGEQRTLGVIAQDVEAVAPEFVNNDGWEGTSPEDNVPLKTIYSTDMMFGMMKAIQEQQALIQTLTARVDAQGAEIAALKGQA